MRISLLRDPTDIEALEELVVDNEELSELEAMLSQFNLFDAIGAVRRELRHSDVLSFLLDPTEAHGLGDHFLRRLLQQAVSLGSTAADAPIRPLTLDLADFDNAEVRREWRSIDVLVVDESNRLAVIIENKIDGTEHSGQLGRYRDVVRAEYPNYAQVPLYLTPDGEPPSDPNYIAISYALIASVVDEVSTRRSTMLHTDVRVMLTHYSQMLRRHIVSDSEIAQLCRRIYKRHRRALDLIFEHRPDPQQRVRELLEQLVGEMPSLILDDSSKGFIRFAPSSWNVPELMGGKGWTKTGRMLLFEFVNQSDRLLLKLVIGPGPSATREKLHQLALANPKTFNKVGKALRDKWTQVFTREFLTAKDYETENENGVSGTVHTRWHSFKMNDLPALTDLIAAQFPSSGS